MPYSYSDTSGTLTPRFVILQVERKQRVAMMDEDSDLMLALASAIEKQGRELSEVRREVFRFLVNRAWKIAMKTRHYLTAQCLDTPCDSAWMVLYKYGTDINFLNATSLTRPAFHKLLRRLARFYYIPRVQSRGRPPKLRYHHQVLELLLGFYVGSMELGSLCMLFGAPPSTLSRSLRRAEDALSKTLGNHAPAQISWPSPALQTELAKLVETRPAAVQRRPAECHVQWLAPFRFRHRDNLLCCRRVHCVVPPQLPRVVERFRHVARLPGQVAGPRLLPGHEDERCVGLRFPMFNRDGRTHPHPVKGRGPGKTVAITPELRQDDP
ncbi:hypothetical protein ON010_g6655 [Phytophthora cinnamomi]|nr:hypothetical protein ON010_g6655 [Phytophthora cinnamomi]